jgi:5-methylcytosine-specific restriction endonuclease McrA
MPIRPENRARYPKDWKAISFEVRAAAEWKCEGSPAWPDCRAENGKPHPATGSTVVLTVAHLDHQPENCDRANLKAWCQRCHNTYDMPMRRAGIAERAKAMRAASDLFGDAA